VALGPQIPNVDPVSLGQLTSALTSLWPGLIPPFALHYAPGGHANSATHIVAVDQALEHVGLKATDRGIPSGTEKELIISDIAVELAMPYAPRMSIMTPIACLPAIAGRVFVANHWYSGTEALDKLAVAAGSLIQQALQGNSQVLLESYGEWFGFGLIFSVGDRNNGNWVVSADGMIIAMIDTEDSLSGTITGAEYKNALQFLGHLPAITSVAPGSRNPTREAVCRGLRAFYKKWCGNHRKIVEILNSRPVSAGFTSNWMQLGHKGFLESALNSLV
jgi:hypothetical protein